MMWFSSLFFLAITPLCFAHQLFPRNKYHPFPHHHSSFRTAKAPSKSPELFLNSSNLHVNGIAIGFFPAFGEAMSPSSATMINSILPSPMAIMGDFLNLDVNDGHLSVFDTHIEELLKLEGNPVYEITLLPWQGLDAISPKVAYNIARKLSSLNDMGISIWLRFGPEMNGDWYPWGNQPKKFIEKFRLISQAVHAIAKDTCMVWAPNSIFNGSTIYMKHGGYTLYWPGPSYVDIVGLSLYHFGGDHRLNVAPKEEEAISIVREFAELYGPNGQGKPVILAETGACYTTLLGNRGPESGGASEVDIKTRWLKQLVDKRMAEISGLKAIVWFEIVKKETATGNTAVKQEDARLLTGSNVVKSAALSLLI